MDMEIDSDHEVDAHPVVASPAASVGAVTAAVRQFIYNSRENGNEIEPAHELLGCGNAQQPLLGCGNAIMHSNFGRSACPAGVR